MNTNFNFKKMFESKGFLGFIIGLGTFLVLAVVFAAGMHIGYEKAFFSDNLGNNYREVFGSESHGPILRALPVENLPGAFGATGKVIKINLPTILVAGPDNIEKTVLVSSTTLIRELQDSDDATSIQIGDYVAVIGAPNNQGEIEAKFIRVMPAPVMPVSSSTIN